jgi:hypothetical protein
MSGMGLRDFINKQQGRGGGSRHFRRWKDEGDHSATVFIHPAGQILALWRHPFMRVEAREDKVTRVQSREVWMDRLVCYESSDVLEKQNYLSRETGEREYPPVLCPFCIMLEHLRSLVADRRLDWRTPLFKFEGTDLSKTRIFHVGGVTGLFNSRKLSDAQKAQMNGTELPAQQDPRWYPPAKWYGPVYQSGPKAAFMQDMRASLEYAFPVVDVNDVKTGVQVAIERSSLGDKIQETIQKSIKGAISPTDPEGRGGDPSVRPFAFRLEYDGRDGVEPAKRYDVIKMGNTPITADIARLLEGAPPDFGKLAERFNLRTIRARLEQHALQKLPLDSYFKKALEWEERHKGESEARAAQERAETRPAPEVGRTEPGFRPPPVQYDPTLVEASKPQGFSPIADDLFGCDKTPNCPGVMRATDTRCPTCGASYEVVAEPPPPPPKLPPRSSVAHAAIPPAAVPAPAAIAIPEPSDAAEPEAIPEPTGTVAGAWPGDPSDDIPFASNTILTPTRFGIASELWSVDRRAFVWE